MKNNDKFTDLRRTGARGTILLGVLCASFLVSSSALAQAPTQGAAGQLFEDALSEIDARNWSRAWELLSAAYELDRRPEYAVNLGMVELKLERHRDAAEHLSFFLREATNASPADRQRVEKKLTEAKAKIGTVMLRVEPAGAEVRLDGRLLKVAASVPLYVEPGKRTFEARKEGLEPASQGVEVLPGEEELVELKLVPAPVAEKQGVPPPPPPGGGRNWALIYTGIGVTTALTVTGFVGAFQAGAMRTEADDIRAGCPERCQAQFDDAEKARVAWTYTSLFTFIGAGVAGGVTAVIYASTGKKSNPSTAPKMGLLAGPGGGGVVLTGSF